MLCTVQNPCASCCATWPIRLWITPEPHLKNIKLRRRCSGGRIILTRTWIPRFASKPVGCGASWLSITQPKAPRTRYWSTFHGEPTHSPFTNVPPERDETTEAATSQCRMPGELQGNG